MAQEYARNERGLCSAVDVKRAGKMRVILFNKTNAFLYQLSKSIYRNADSPYLLANTKRAALGFYSEVVILST